LALIYTAFAALGVWLWVPLYWWLLLFLAYAVLSIAWQWSVFPLRSWWKGRVNGVIMLLGTILTGVLLVGTFIAIPLVWPSHLAKCHPWQWHYQSPHPQFEFLIPYGKDLEEKEEGGFRVFRQRRNRLLDELFLGSFEVAFRRFPEINVPDPAVLGWHALAAPNAEEVAHGRLEKGMFWTEFVIRDGQPNGRVVGIRKVYYSSTGIWVLDTHVGHLVLDSLRFSD